MLIFFVSEASKSRCAVVIFVNQSSSISDDNFSDYLDNIQGLSINKTEVYFSDDPDSFKVKHGKFIDAPGLFALESEKFPGMYLRRKNHTVVLQKEDKSDSFSKFMTRNISFDVNRIYIP